jgi:hypothetical protein
VLISPVTGVGAVGVPVNDGEAIVALNAISLVFEVILAVFVEILVSNAVMLAVFEVILFVFVVTLASMDVILALLLVTLVSIAVILFVFDAILVGKVAIVAELTPPTLFTVGASAVPPKSFAN